VGLSGELFVGGGRVRTAETFRAVEASSGEYLEPPFDVAGAAIVDQACELAWSAFQPFRELGAERRARFLELIAEQIMGLGDALLHRAAAESGLPLARLTGERARTANQLRLFAGELGRGGWWRIRVDPAQPERLPQPRPDLRQYQVPLGPVAVFGASNFPLAFSVAGGDTASALAAGCPVIVKGHPAHPGTSELIAQAIVAAAEMSGMPAGVFSLLNGPSNELGAALVRHPYIRAVGFTGSRAGGLALMQIARERAEPIPVYAEMSSINPVVLLPAALAADAPRLAKEFVESVTLGTGQFCTNPGFLLALESPALDRFIAAAADALKAVTPTAMLTGAIQKAYVSRVERLLQHPRVSVIGRGNESASARCGRAALFCADAATFLQHAEISEEVFGPSSVVIRCANEAQLFEVLQQLEGQLTASLHFVEQDENLVRALLPLLERTVGRVIANGWPTGVEVAHAMVHGGPFPATSDGRSTSVGTLAIERFLRPVCYQNFPDSLLPQPLRTGAFILHPHRYDGEYRTGA